MRHVILIVHSDDQRLESRQAATRAEGYLPLPASTISRALFLLAKVRPTIVLSDADLSDGRAIALLQEIRAMPSHAQLIVIVLGPMSAEEHERVRRDPFAHAHPLDDDETVLTLVKKVLPAEPALRPHVH